MPTYTSPQDGSTLDTFINSDAGSTNYNTNAAIDVGESNVSSANCRTLIQFPGLTDGSINASATVLSASLFLKISADASSNARTFRVYRSKKTGIVFAEVTWVNYKTGTAWTSSGGFNVADCENTDIGSASFSASESVDTWKEFVLTPSAIQEIISGTWTPNILMIKADTEDNDRYNFYSSNDATSGNRPYIVVTTRAGYPKVVWL
jgi:hypothetical protein